MSFNKIALLGNLGRDPELRYTPQGTPVCSFTMATNERRKDKNGEQQDITTWFRPTFFGKQAETISQHFQKGDQIYVEGRLRLDEWTDRDGKQRVTLEVAATDFQFVSSKNGNGEQTGSNRGNDAAPRAANRPAPQPATAAEPGGYDGDLGDDIPF